MINLASAPNRFNCIEITWTCWGHTDALINQLWLHACLLDSLPTLWSISDWIVTIIGSHDLQILGLLKLILDPEFHNVNKLFGDLIQDVMYPHLNMLSVERSCFETWYMMSCNFFCFKRLALKQELCPLTVSSITSPVER